MNKLIAVIIFMLVTPMTHAQNKENNRMAGIWEGYYSGSHTHQGLMVFNITQNECTVSMHRLLKTDSYNFDCEQLSDQNGMYQFSLKRPFKTGQGFVQWKFNGALSAGSINPAAPQIFIGSWIQGMKKSKDDPFTALNSGHFRLKLKKEHSIISKYKNAVEAAPLTKDQ
ncbi:hypothetical protein [Pseudoalteromonas luteoviolacea]|nr:hypothetical protein [Pseudoalteromonas luteoviolacea]MBE0388423.1 hypothetical protein [Pseudoalteromonas luteoviolacea DSM 6061]